MNPIYNNFASQDIQKTNVNQTNNVSNLNRNTNSGFEFNKVLQNTIDNESVKFSKHASSRLSSRNINLSNEQIERVSDGISKAKEKGIRDSLVLVDNIALVVNVRSNTVITAMGNENTDVANNNQIYTNIDGAVIV